jgi:DNA-binding SARP family transcriptional activator/predicted ATPase/Tfp pilus assembly protein PilF
MDKSLRISLLGTLLIEQNGRPLTDLGTRKAEALLAYLVCQERPFARETLAELLWEDRDPQQALANLRSLLSGMRAQLAPYLVITRHTVAFNHASDYWLDVAEFNGLLEIGDWRLPIANRQSLQQAIALYRGDFLAGFYVRESRGFEEWVLLERERLQRKAIVALRQLVDEALAGGDTTTGLRHVEQLLALDNLSEHAHRDKILLLARAGQINAALSHYKSYCQLLADELGVAPGPETETLVARIRAARSRPLPDFPPQATPFVGRGRELAELSRRLSSPQCRLLTLLGPGGMGKTRLALAVLERLTDTQPGRFLNGVCYVPLAGLAGPALLPTAVAEACGLHFQGPTDPLAQLIAFLKPQEMLLALDNFEHLFGPHLGPLDGVDVLLTILQEAPLVKLFVTSRTRLQLQEEWVFDLGGLDYPATDAAADWEAHSAIRLFRQHATRLRHDFAPTPEDYRAMAQVCRLLDGQPLGIELAAAWVRDFDCPQIAAQIQADVAFLSTTLRNVPPRHRSLTAVFDHSWQLLTAAEQAIFARLSVFQGDFDAAAALAIAYAPPADLAGLAAKSLLRQGGNGRYDIHELLRQYAAQHLARLADEPTQTAVRHAAYFLELLARQGEGEAPDQRQAILADLPNIRAAWDWAARQPDEAALLRAAKPLHGFYSVQSWFQEGIEAFQFALAHLTGAPEGRALVLCDLLSRQARLRIHVGQLTAARQALDEALTYLPQVDDPERHAAILGYVAITHFYAGDFDRAAEIAGDSLRWAEVAGDAPGVAFAHNFLGSCAKAQGDYALARDRFSRAVAAYRALGDDLGAAMVLNNLGNVAQAMGDFATAQQFYLECSGLFKALDHRHGAATTLANAGRLALKQGDTTQARQLLAESLGFKRQQQDDRGTAVALVGLGGVSLATGDLGQASAELAEALTLAQRSGDVKLTLEALNALAALAARRGRPEMAAQLLAFILHNKATAQEVRDAANKLLVEVTAVLAPAVLAAENGLDLETAVALCQSLR